MTSPHYRADTPDGMGGQCSRSRDKHASMHRTADSMIVETYGYNLTLSICLWEQKIMRARAVRFDACNTEIAGPGQ